MACYTYCEKCGEEVELGNDGVGFVFHPKKPHPHPLRKDRSVHL